MDLVLDVVGGHPSMPTAGALIEVRQLIRQGWEKVATEYARDRTGIFQRSAGRLLDLLDPAPGSTLLDVGCGAGAVTLPAAARVGSRGQVVGCDIAKAMVSLAAAQASQPQSAKGLHPVHSATLRDVDAEPTEGKANPSYCQMDAGQLGFRDASFDAVTCAFSLFQFPGMGQALAEMWRVLRPDGRLALSNWGPGYFSPVASLQRELFREFGLKPLLTNPIAFKPGQLKVLLREAGFTAVEMITETENVCFESPAEVWAFDLDMGPFPVMLEGQLSAGQRAELAQRFVAMLENLKTEQGIECSFHLLYARARKD